MVKEERLNGYLEERAGLIGKTAIVVGGGGGIGAAVSLTLANAGVDVAICDIDGEALAATAQVIGRTGRLIAAHEIDAFEPAALDHFYDAVGETVTRLDTLVNIAGGTRRRPFMETSEAQVAADIQGNYGYVIQSLRRAIPLLRRSGAGGSVINFTSIEAHRGAAHFAVYAGAKAATANFSRAMAVELGKDRIRVNCIAPDTTLSKGNAAAMPPELAELAELAEGFASLAPHVQPAGMAMYIPRGEQPPAEALGDAVLFLASDLSTFVSGMTLHVDGGTMAAAGFLEWPHGDGFVPVPLAGTLRKIFAGE